MQLNLNYWKVILLLIPFIAASLLMDFGYSHGNSHKGAFEIANYLLIIDILLVNTCQVIILISFINATKNDLYFKINALIPIGFLISYLLYVIYLSLAYPHHISSNYGPLKKSDLHGSTLILFLFFIYTAINFLFTNNNYVSWQIKKMPDTDKQTELKIKYLKPMRTLVRTSVWIAAACLLISTIIDISRLY